MTDKVFVLRCADCDEEVSGTDEKSVKETMDRHVRQTGHQVKADDD